MANICDFSMRIKGDKANCMAFIDAMQQKNNVYMGRGAYVYIDAEEVEDDIVIMQCSGECKWSIQSALIDNAISMREDPARWYFGENIDVSKLEFITLYEACNKFHVDCEIYSEECGCEFQEHFLIIDGEIEDNSCVDWHEVDLEYYRDENDRESAEEALGRPLTDDEWENETNVSEGGFEWDFNI